MIVPPIESGYVQGEISNSAYEYQKKVESKDRIVVGVNKFQVEEPPPSGLLRVDKSVEEGQVEKLKKLRSERDNQAVIGSLDKLKKAAEKDTNLMPLILDAVKAQATLGEICDALREVFGEYIGSASF